MKKVIDVTTHEMELKDEGDVLTEKNVEMVHCDDGWSFLAEKGMYKKGDIVKEEEEFVLCRD